MLTITAKTLNRSRGVKVTSTSSTAPGIVPSTGEVYGTNINDEFITLGVPDVYKRAIYESNDSTDALPPKLTLA